MIDFVASFIVFFAVIDPIGTVPVFVAVTSCHDEAATRNIAVQATIISALILILFLMVSIRKSENDRREHVRNDGQRLGACVP